MADTIHGRKVQSLRYRLKVTLEEDLHTGTGTGSSAVDALQTHDRAGRPVVWWSHLKGVLRAAAEDLVENNRARRDQVSELFGDKDGSQGGRLMGHSLYLVEAAAKVGATHIWSSTALQPRSRMPREDTLRSTEVIAATTQFAAELRLPPDADLRDLLERSVKHMDALGLGRNRGQGRVCTDLSVIKDDPHPQRLDQTELTSAAGLSSPLTYCCALRLLLRNLDPINLPTTGDPGNIIPTESFIRGQTLFGALANWARGDAESEHLLFSAGAISVGDALPLPSSHKTPDPSQPESWASWDVLPIPLYVKTPKPESDSADWPWWLEPGRESNYLGARREVDELAELLRPNRAEVARPGSKAQPEKRKRPKDREYLFRGDAKAPWVRYAPSVGVHLRNQTRDAERPDGALFSTDEIAEDTLFLATLSFARREDATHFGQRFAPVLAKRDWLAVGRGGRPMEVVACQWEIRPSAPPGDSAEWGQGPLTLTLTSDLIARDLVGRDGSPPSLGFFDRLDPQVLADLTGVESLRTLDTKQWFEVSEALEVRGYNAVVGRPRTPAVAIRRGSGILIRNSAAAAALRRALTEAPALGERQDEGFGRFRLDLPLGLDAEANGGKPKEGPGSPQAPARPSEDLLEKVFALADKLRTGTLPSRSQWEALRQEIAATATPKDQVALIERLENHAKTVGGGSWKSVVKPVKEALQELNANDARFFVDALVRKLRPTLRRGRD